ncbi:MAG: hypothetical protein LOY00_01280, partial [Methylocaldum sp.]|nr:hypothetical protein [Methylocaldum sp.]
MTNRLLTNRNASEAASLHQPFVKARITVSFFYSSWLERKHFLKESSHPLDFLATFHRGPTLPRHLLVSR